MAISVRQNKNTKGIPVEGSDLKISLFADDSTCFLDGSCDSFNHLFTTLNRFAKCSGCKINLSKSNAIWVGAKKGSQYFPFSNQGLIWKSNPFKALGINFSINTGFVYNLNYEIKLYQIESLLNCWRARNFSLIGKICVIKTLLLPQLLYLFSVLCIKTGVARGESATPDSEKIAKNREKSGKIGKKEENREEKAKSGKFHSLCPSWQIGLATLLHIWRLKNHDISRYFLQNSVKCYILHCKKHTIWRIWMQKITAIHCKLRK